MRLERNPAIGYIRFGGSSHTVKSVYNDRIFHGSNLYGPGELGARNNTTGCVTVPSLERDTEFVKIRNSLFVLFWNFGILFWIFWIFLEIVGYFWIIWRFLDFWI